MSQTSRRDKLLKSTSMDDALLTHVRFVVPDDAAFICALRADPNLNQHISKSSAAVEHQRTWIENYKKREEEGEEFYFVIRHQAQDLGVVRMYDFRGNSFCWGSWIIQPSKPSGLVTYSAIMIYKMGFDTLGFEQSHFDVRIENEKVINFHIRSGAEPTTRDDIDQHFVFPNSKWPAFRSASDSQIKMHQVAG